MKYPKFHIPVKITLEDGSKLFGAVYVRQNQRVLDVLVDERRFMPFRMRDRTVILNKSRILQVDLLEMDEIRAEIDILPKLDFDYLAANNW